MWNAPRIPHINDFDNVNPQTECDGALKFPPNALNSDWMGHITVALGSLELSECWHCVSRACLSPLSRRRLRWRALKYELYSRFEYLIDWCAQGVEQQSPVRQRRAQCMATVLILKPAEIRQINWFSFPRNRFWQIVKYLNYSLGGCTQPRL